MSKTSADIRIEVLQALSIEPDSEKRDACISGILYGLSFGMESSKEELAAELLFWLIEAGKR